MTLPADVARCPGVGYPEDGEIDWREGCEHCLRRTSPPADPERVWYMSPPPILVFGCDYLIEPTAPINAGRRTDFPIPCTRTP